MTDHASPYDADRAWNASSALPHSTVVGWMDALASRAEDTATGRELSPRPRDRHRSPASLMTTMLVLGRHLVRGRHRGTRVFSMASTRPSCRCSRACHLVRSAAAPHRAGPGSAARRRDPRRRAAAVWLAISATRSHGGRHDGHRVRHRLCGGWPGSTLASSLAELLSKPIPLRLHERHRADGVLHPSHILRLLGFPQSRRKAAAPAGVGNRPQKVVAGSTNLVAFAGRRQRPRPDPGPEAPAARPGHVDCRGRRHYCGRASSISRRDPVSRCSVPCLKGCRCQASRLATSTTSCRS